MVDTHAAAVARSLAVVIVNQSPSAPVLQLASALGARGHDVMVICGSAAVRGPLSHVNCLGLGDYDARSTFTRAWSWLAFTVRAALHLLTVPAEAVVLVSTNPPLMPGAAAAVGYLRRFALVVRVLDIYPDVLEAAAFCRWLPMRRVLAALARWTYKRADAVVTLGDVMAARLAAYLPRERIQVLPEWVTGSDHRSDDGDSDSAAPFRVIAAGNVGLTHDLRPVLDAAQLMRHEPVLFVVSSGRSFAAAALDDIRQNLCFVPRLPDADYRRLLDESHAAILSLRPPAESCSFPSRALSFLAHRLPLVALTQRPSDLAALIDRYSCGVVVAPDEGAAGLARALRFLQNDPAVWKRMSLAASTAARTFDASVWLPKFMNLIEATGSAHDPRRKAVTADRNAAVAPPA